MMSSPDWISAVAELIFALGAVGGGIWGVYTYRKSKRTEAAEWINELFRDFYLNDRFEEIRRGLEYHYDEDIQNLIEGRLTERDRNMKPLDDEDIELLAQIDDLLNYFEHISYLEQEGHIKTEDKEVMFEYWFRLLDQPKFAAIRRYVSKFGFDRITDSLDAPKEDYIMIYGTLMQGYKGYEELSLDEYLTKVGTCTLSGKLYDLEDYPGLILQSDLDSVASDQLQSVEGEIYRVDNESIFGKMDEFERYDPNGDSLYVRQMVRLDDPPLDAWVYVYNRSVEDATVIESGDWRSYSN